MRKADFRAVNVLVSEPESRPHRYETLSATMAAHLYEVACHLNGSMIAGSGGNLPPGTAHALLRRGLVEITTGKHGRAWAQVTDAGYRVACQIAEFCGKDLPGKAL